MKAVHIASGRPATLTLSTSEHPLLPGVAPVLVTNWGWPVDHRTWAISFCELEATPSERALLASAGFSLFENERYGERCRNCGHVWFRMLGLPANGRVVCPRCRVSSANEGLPGDKKRRRRVVLW